MLLKRVKCKPMYHPLEPNITWVTKCKLMYFSPKVPCQGCRGGAEIWYIFPTSVPMGVEPPQSRRWVTEIVISTQNLSSPVQQQGVLHSFIYVLSHYTMPCILQQEHFPSSSSHFCKGGKCRQKERKGRPLSFCNRVISPRVSLCVVPKLVFYIPASRHAPKGSADWQQGRRPAAWWGGARQHLPVTMAVTV